MKSLQTDGQTDRLTTDDRWSESSLNLYILLMHFCNVTTGRSVYTYFDSRYQTIQWVHKIAAVAQWVRAFVPQAEGWVFEFSPRQTLVLKTGSDTSAAKRSASHKLGFLLFRAHNIISSARNLLSRAHDTFSI